MSTFVVSAEDHYPGLDWGRKINFCSFSSMNLNMEHVSFSYTFHLPDTYSPLPFPLPHTPIKKKK